MLRFWRHIQRVGSGCVGTIGRIDGALAGNSAGGGGDIEGVYLLSLVFDDLDRRRGRTKFSNTP